jgi:hypothetical protein
MAQEATFSSKVTHAWALRDMYVNLNGSELCDIDIVDYECLYGGCQVPATLSFVDTKGHTTGDKNKAGNIGVGGFVDIGFITSDGCEHEESFVITKVSTENNTRNQKLVKLQLEDLETRNMKGSYKTKGYPGEKFTNVIKSHMKEIGNDALRFGKEFITAVPKDIKEIGMNIVVPGHMNFHDFLTTEIKDRGFSFIKDRAMNYLVHDSHKEFDNLLDSKNIFEYDSLNAFDFNRIVQFNLEGFDMESFLCSIPTSNTSLTLQDAGTDTAVKGQKGADSKISKKDPKESKSTVKVSGIKNTDIVSTRGLKQGSQVGKNQQYFETLNNAQKCSIWVPGRVDNLVGKKVQVVFPKPTYYASDSDKLFTGYWEVYLVRDKVMGSFYLNELFLRRPGGETQK